MLKPEFYSLIPVLRMGISQKPYKRVSLKKEKNDTWVDNINILLKENTDKEQYQFPNIYNPQSREREGTRASPPQSQARNVL